ncbi:MAG: hydrolase [Planctomycetes bacterium]|nr:hydrolase [Planctomycetota bacterium]
MLRPDTLDVDRAMVLVIDVQTKLLPLVREHAAVLKAACKLLDGAHIFGVPVLATEQYPQGIGPTDPTVKARLVTARAKILEKPTFSACGERPLRDALLELDRPQIVITGIETHVCVLQTALDLAVMDYDVFVCADATASRGEMDHDIALARMREAGVHVTTVESVLFELCRRCDTDRFKQMLKIIKSSTPA